MLVESSSKYDRQSLMESPKRDGGRSARLPRVVKEREWLAHLRTVRCGKNVSCSCAVVLSWPQVESNGKYQCSTAPCHRDKIMGHHEWDGS